MKCHRWTNTKRSIMRMDGVTLGIRERGQESNSLWVGVGCDSDQGSPCDCLRTQRTGFDNTDFFHLFVPIFLAVQEGWCPQWQLVWTMVKEEQLADSAMNSSDVRVTFWAMKCSAGLTESPSTMILSSPQFRVDADNSKPLCQAKCKVCKTEAESPWKQHQDRQWGKRKWAAEGWHQQRSIKPISPLADLLPFVLTDCQDLLCSPFHLLMWHHHSQPLTKTFFGGHLLIFLWPLVMSSWFQSFLEIQCCRFPQISLTLLYGTGVMWTLLKQRWSKQC